MTALLLPVLFVLAALLAAASLVHSGRGALAAFHALRGQLAGGGPDACAGARVTITSWRVEPAQAAAPRLRPAATGRVREPRRRQPAMLAAAA